MDKTENLIVELYAVGMEIQSGSVPDSEKLISILVQAADKIEELKEELHRAKEIKELYSKLFEMRLLV